MRNVRCVLVVLGAFLSIAGYGQVSAPSVTDASRMYGIISAVSPSDRRVVFRNLSPELKAALWKIHLSQFLEAPSLSIPQRQLVQAAMALCIPAVYENGVDPNRENVSEPLARIEQSIRNLFPPDVAANVFAMLGPPPTTDDPSTPRVMIRTSSSIGTIRRVVPLDDVPDCECSRVSDYCSTWGGNAICIGGPCNQVSGCGTFWGYKCTGLCQDNNQ